MSHDNSRAKFTELVRLHNENKLKRCARQPTCHIRTFGCQQNFSDSEKLKGMLCEMGYAISQNSEEAELILFNTCAVRENAEDRVFGNVGALKAQKENNRDMIICLYGCMMQQPHIADRIRTQYPYVDIVLGTHAIARLPEILYKKLSEGGRLIEIPQEDDGGLNDDLPAMRDGSVRAWVPVMYGCDNFCSYCVVPLVRGRERSRELSSIKDEVAGLVKGGFKEIGLLGQNVNSYGKTLKNPVSFARLLRELNDIPGDFRIRFMTSHPKDCTHELIDTIADCEKVCNHIHLPVQSGSDRILKAMNRGYTAKSYLDLIRYARKRIPEVSFTSDIIVGFPGEDEDDFAKTIELIETARYHSLFTFLYSKREGTKAAGMPDTVSKEDKARRFDRMLSIQREIGGSHHKSMVGSLCRVLVDGKGKTGENRLAGKTPQNVIAEFDGDESLIGSFVDIKVTGYMLWAVIGEII